MWISKKKYNELQEQKEYLLALIKSNEEVMLDVLNQSVCMATEIAELKQMLEKPKRKTTKKTKKGDK